MVFQTQCPCYLLFLIELCAGHAKNWLEWKGIQTIHNQWFVKVIVTFNKLLVIWLFNPVYQNDVLFFFTDKEETRYAKLLLASKEDVLKQVITLLMLVKMYRHLIFMYLLYVKFAFNHYQGPKSCTLFS